MRIEINRYIVADSEICHGKPAFKGTRILVGDILELIAAGESVEKLLGEYPSLNKEMIREALGYAAELVGGESYAKFKVSS